MRATLRPMCCKTKSSGPSCKLPHINRGDRGARFPKPVTERLESLRDDAQRLYENRLAGIAAVDAIFRDIIKKDLELHKQLTDKWISLAKQDLTNVVDSCAHGGKRHQQAVPFENDSGDAGTADPDAYDAYEKPAAAEAFYEPWVIDD